jgi:hypothetical protein
MKTSIGQNMQNKSNSVFKIQSLMFNGLHPFFSQLLECLLKTTLYLRKQKILQLQLPHPLQIETFCHEGTGP